jgi:ATP-dependent Clp protease adapter protein ClpS
MKTAAKNSKKTAKTNRKPKAHQVILHDSPSHTPEFVADLVKKTMLIGGNGILTDDEAKAIAVKVHTDGKAPIYIGSRKNSRTIVKMVKEAGEDTRALQLAASAGFNLPSTGSMRTTISRCAWPKVAKAPKTAEPTAPAVDADPIPAAAPVAPLDPWANYVNNNGGQVIPAHN